MSTRPSRQEACVQGEKEAAPGWRAAPPRREHSPPEPTPPASLLPLQASCVQYRLVVRDANTLQICQLYTCLDQIQHIEWSADSLFILCALYKRGLVQVWSLEQPEWHCKIDEGSAGLVASCWSPDGRHILNTTEFHLRITVWSLCTKSVSYIKYPKACQQGITFTRDGRYLALAERRDCKDYVSILVCSDWQLLRHFDTDTQDLAGIEWAPNGCVLAAWDSCLEYKILLYSLDGRLLSTFCAYEWSLGIKSVAWSPSSQFLAVGSYDGKVRILNHVTWKMITEFGHPATINNPKIVVYKEAEKSPPLVLGRLAFPPPRAAAGPLSSTESEWRQRSHWDGHQALQCRLARRSSGNTASQGRAQGQALCAAAKFPPSPVFHEVASVPVSLQTLKPAADRANPRIGIGALAFSPDNCFLATRSDSVPTAVWIWDIQKLRLLAVLEQLSAVRCFQWDPRQARLAICTGGGKVYLWSPAGCVSVQVPGEGDFQVLSVCWHPSGDSLALLSKDHFCLCFLETEQGVGTAFGQRGDHT
ncbi:WD repeat-containing protein WRAP73 isoform X2 [Delphinapterus leucas]|uniref:WD repeat-containing protein WRAP73 isoform X2 n=1 Tax=Delphinapterus leucas TaxID=9749 RepID=A0A2Y9Q4H1_DELLE|nr:WD repeat-containing protein WRAP73 isoform X2 [Delphinapterus leucas]